MVVNEVGYFFRPNAMNVCRYIGIKHLKEMSEVLLLGLQAERLVCLKSPEIPLRIWTFTVRGSFCPTGITCDTGSIAMEKGGPTASARRFSCPAESL